MTDRNPTLTFERIHPEELVAGDIIIDDYYDGILDTEEVSLQTVQEVDGELFVGEFDEVKRMSGKVYRLKKE